jgi:hypothetical protein
MAQASLVRKTGRDGVISIFYPIASLFIVSAGDRGTPRRTFLRGRCGSKRVGTNPSCESRRGGPGYRGESRYARSTPLAWGVPGLATGGTGLRPKPASGRSTRRRKAQPREGRKPLPVSPTRDGAEPGTSRSSVGRGTLLYSVPRNRLGGRRPAETAPPREGRPCDGRPVGQPTTDVTGRTKSTANLGSPIAAGVALRCPRVVRG